MRLLSFINKEDVRDKGNAYSLAFEIKSEFFPVKKVRGQGVPLPQTSKQGDVVTRNSVDKNRVGDGFNHIMILAIQEAGKPTFQHYLL